MEESQLRDRLTELHRELEAGPEVHEETRRLLVAITDDIRRMLQRPEAPTSSEHESMIERLRAAGRNLESSHPKLTTAVSQLVEALTRPFQ